MNTTLCLFKKLIIFNLLILNIKYFEIDIPPYTSTGVSAGIEAFKPRYTEVEHRRRQTSFFIVGTSVPHKIVLKWLSIQAFMLCGL